VPVNAGELAAEPQRKRPTGARAGRRLAGQRSPQAVLPIPV